MMNEKHKYDVELEYELEKLSAMDRYLVNDPKYRADAVMKLLNYPGLLAELSAQKASLEYNRSEVNRLNNVIANKDTEIDELKNSIKQKEIAAFEAGQKGRIMAHDYEERETKWGAHNMTGVMYIPKYRTLEDYLKEKEK